MSKFGQYQAETNMGLCRLINPVGSGFAMFLLRPDGSEWARLMPGSWVHTSTTYTWEERPLPVSWLRRVWRSISRLYKGGPG